MTNANGNDYIQLEFSIYDYLVEDDSNIYVYIDNKLNNDIIIDRIVEDDCVYYKFVLDLYYKDELVQLMSFSWNSHHNAWEIIRGCPGSNNIVVGGVSKLFKHFIKENNL